MSFQSNNGLFAYLQKRDDKIALTQIYSRESPIAIRNLSTKKEIKESLDDSLDKFVFVSF